MPQKADKTGRSKRQLSSFIALERFVKSSPAWQSLSLVARSAYWELLDLYNGGNNGRIGLSARGLADRLPISRATATRAFRELIEHGFIEAVHRGGFNLKRGERRATEWRLTRFMCDATGKPPTKAFMNWRPKIYSTASPESHNGFTRGPPSPVTKQNCRKMALS
jgi:hypothetical protein